MEKGPEGAGSRSGVGAVPVVSIVGHSGSGKTTLLEKLIRELKGRGYRLAVVKHHYHRGVALDRPGKDTWRFAQAGADEVVLAGPDQVAHVRRFEREPTLEEVVGGIGEVDLILTEGYKEAGAPKIEVSRGGELVSPAGDLVAVVSDGGMEVGVPWFGLEDMEGLARFVEEEFLG
ncbi:MAG: molybdopterin-guanine dinucleotide biosynthesis protein B [Chloroflexota bacterium]|nr:molybdopterin-guanine dinucleotide biosynthesis protein B [Chloroflexota bacterium]